MSLAEIIAQFEARFQLAQAESEARLQAAQAESEARLQATQTAQAETEARLQAEIEARLRAEREKKELTSAALALPQQQQSRSESRNGTFCMIFANFLPASVRTHSHRFVDYLIILAGLFLGLSTVLNSFSWCLGASRSRRSNWKYSISRRLFIFNRSRCVFLRRIKPTGCACYSILPQWQPDFCERCSRLAIWWHCALDFIWPEDHGSNGHCERPEFELLRPSE